MGPSEFALANKVVTPYECVCNNRNWRLIPKFLGSQYLIENNRFEKALQTVKELDYLNSTLLMSQTKKWVEDRNLIKFKKA